MAQANIALYRITDVGLYKKNQEAPFFGDLSSFLSDILRWVKSGIPLSHTCPFGPDSPSDMTAEAENALYCYDMLQKDDDWIFIGWNRLTGANGSVPVVVGDSPVGTAVIRDNTLKQNEIPGFPTYYWINTKENVLATIRLGNSGTGIDRFERYIKEFIEKLSRYVVVGKLSDADEDDQVIKGYSDPNDPKKKVHSAYSRFRLKAMRKNELIEFIRASRDKIRKITKKNRLEASKRKGTGLFRRVLTAIGLERPELEDKAYRIRYEVEYTPTNEELDEIIQEWERSPMGRWDDTGFTFKGRTETYWLSASLARGEISLSGTGSQLRNNGMQLLDAIVSKKSEILRIGK